MPIVIGLGTGRCGTQSLSALIHAQPNGVCFHEVNPACMAWEGTEHTVLSLIRDFRSALNGGFRSVTIDRTSPGRDSALQKYLTLDSIGVVGDIGSYYLPYVPMLLEEDIRFPCIRRDKDATLESFMKKLRINKPDSRRMNLASKLYEWASGIKAPEYRNHWGASGDPDPKWDKCYPDFPGSLREAVGKYWDMYYNTAEALSAQTDKVRIFDIDDLNTEAGQEDILTFCGFTANHVLGRYHTNLG